MSDPLMLTLLAPLSGVVVPIEAVPDDAFSQRLVGDGVALDPLSETVLAPCDATVLQVHRAKHAITLEARGVEIVIHVGLDTVRIDGAGLRPLVTVGQRVKAGEPLLRFEPDVVARHAEIPDDDVGFAADLRGATEWHQIRRPARLDDLDAVVHGTYSRVNRIQCALMTPTERTMM